MIIGVDIGLSGGIAVEGEAIDMPVRRVIDKLAVMEHVKENGKPKFYKSGPRKGEAVMKIKKAAKVHNELDLKMIYELFNWHDPTTVVSTTVVFEAPGNSQGNGARMTATTHRNFGKQLAVAELAGCESVVVSANKWKKDLGLDKDKEKCVAKAEALSGLSFRTERGALIDGPAEAWLIQYWYQKDIDNENHT